MNSDMDLMKYLAHIKDEKHLESQKELILIKEIKRNLSDKLMRIYLPPGFAEFYLLMETIDYYDKPEYEKLIRVLEKAREVIPLYPKHKLYNNTLVDQDVRTLYLIYL